MSETSVSERRIRPIQDHIATSNWKQALQLCDKWSKKGESSDLFLATKAFVLVNQHDGPQQQRGATETTRLCTRNPAITDIAALEQLQLTITYLEDLSLISNGGTNIWDRAAAAKPGDKDLLMTWLKRSVEKNEWLSAQKATMALRKAFPHERKYDFWNIVFCDLIHMDDSLPEKDRKLFGMLGFRLISKAADSVPKDKSEILSSGKAIQTPEELYLLTQIYLNQGKAPEAVKLLQSEKFGLESRFAEQDSQLVMTLLLRALEAAKQWEEAFNTCTQLIIDEKFDEFDPTNDDRVWKLLFKSSKELAQTVNGKPLSDLVEDKMDKNPKLRARIKLQSAQEQLAFNGSQSDLLTACKAYYYQFATKGHCFEDLKLPISSLTGSSVDAFLKAISSVGADSDSSPESAAILRLLNLKLRYWTVVSSTDDMVLVRDFAADALKLYGTSVEQKIPLPEACLLAAVALLEVGIGKQGVSQCDSVCVVQALTILKGCCKPDEEYYPALLLLTRLQLSLGVVSSAMTSFRKLGVKNMQWETMGHLILTRSATLHPMQYGKITPSEDSGFNPLEALDVTLEVAENAGKSLSRGISEGLNCGSYVNVAEIVQMKSEIGRSLNVQIAAIEEKRIKRLRATFDDESQPSRSPFLVDKRDLKSYVDFAKPDSQAARSSLCGPVPGKMWLGIMSLQVETSRLLINALQSHSGVVSLTLHYLEQLLTLTKSSNLFEGRELTPAERHNHECHRLVAEALVCLEGSAAGQTQLDRFTNQMAEWLEGKCVTIHDSFRSTSPETHHGKGISCINGTRAPSWEFLHSSFSKLETLQLLSHFTAVAAKRSKSAKTKSPGLSKEQISNLQKLISEAQTSIHGDAKSLKQGLNASGILGKLVDASLGKKEEQEDSESDVVGIEIEKLCDAVTLETMCGDLKESWEEALDGILAVKVKTFK